MVRFKDINGDTRYLFDLNGSWVPARPVNYKYRSLKQKLKDAWLVFTGKADPFIWPEDDEEYK